MLANLDQKSGTNIERLMAMGFRLSFKVERLTASVHRDARFLSLAQLTAYPERGKALRRFGKQGPAAAEVHSNIELGIFAAEREAGRRELRDTYAERCATELIALVDRTLARVA